VQDCGGAGVTLRSGSALLSHSRVVRCGGPAVRVRPAPVVVPDEIVEEEGGGDSDADADGAAAHGRVTRGRDGVLAALARRAAPPAALAAAQFFRVSALPPALALDHCDLRGNAGGSWDLPGGSWAARAGALAISGCSYDAGPAAGDAALSESDADADADGGDGGAGARGGGGGAQGPVPRGGPRATYVCLFDDGGGDAALGVHATLAAAAGRPARRVLLARAAGGARVLVVSGRRRLAPAGVDLSEATLAGVLDADVAGVGAGAGAGVEGLPTLEETVRPLSSTRRRTPPVFTRSHFAHARSHTHAHTHTHTRSRDLS
jgi:hypothetical protein